MKSFKNRFHQVTSDERREHPPLELVPRKQLVQDPAQYELAIELDMGLES